MTSETTDPDTEVCRECGRPVTPTDNWTSEQLQVCSDCWWNELDGEERKMIAQEANEK